jgi:ubiquitin-conjugating enzyme E2 J2
MSGPASTRLKKEYKKLVQEPFPSIIAAPSDKNILEWHFVLRGNADSDFSGGQYHGKIRFPPEYPFAPPSIMVITPSGKSFNYISTNVDNE